MNKEGKDEILSVRMSPRKKREIEQIAMDTDDSVSRVVRELLREAMRARKERLEQGNGQ